MAIDDGYEVHFPSYMRGSEIDMFVSMCGGEYDIVTDPQLQAHFHTAFFDGLSGEDWDRAYESLKDYIRDEYDLNFDREFDWEAYRAWYG